MRTIEHGNLIDDAAAKLMAEKGMFLVANLVAYYAMKERAAEFGMTAEMLAKNELVHRRRPAVARDLQARTASRWPTAATCWAQLQVDQSREFLLRREVLSPIEIIRSATTIGAEILRMEGKLGTLAPGAFADLLVVDGDPLKDLALLQDQGKHLSVIMKAGTFHKNAGCSCDRGVTRVMHWR